MSAPSPRGGRPIKAAPLLVIVAAGFALVAPGRGAFSQSSFTVDSTTDAVDADPGDGVCASEAGDCTLRAAIQETNALPGPDVINVPAGEYRLTIEGRQEDDGATGDLDVTDDLTIRGAGADETTVDGTAIDRVIEADRLGRLNIALTIDGVTITNGRADVVPFSGDFHSGSGGGIRSNDGVSLSMQHSAVTDSAAELFGGAIYHAGGFQTEFAVDNVVIARNTAGQGGGGIVKSGSGEIRNSTISDNTALGTGGIENGGLLTITNSLIRGNAGTTGGISNTGSGTLLIQDSVISENSGRYAGGSGIRGGGTIHMIRSEVRRNISPDEGGGVYYTGGEAGQVAVRIENSAIWGNQAGTDGGGLYTWTPADIVIENSTFSSNSAGDRGGALFVLFGNVSLANTTIAANAAGQDAGAVAENEGNAESGFGLRAQNTLLAENQPGACSRMLVSGGHNLEDGDSCGLGSEGDLASTPGLLGGLEKIAGLPVHPLMVGSPAIDASDNEACPPADQLGRPRPLDGDGDGTARCDIGAYEAPTAVAPPTDRSPTPFPTGTPASLPRTGGAVAASGTSWATAAGLVVGLGFVLGTLIVRQAPRKTGR